MFEIEKDIEIPKYTRSKKYPWKEMEVGDSFFVLRGKQHSIMTCSYRNGKALNRKFLVRTLYDGVRVWRIE